MTCVIVHLFFMLFIFYFTISRYFPEHKLPDNVIATTDAKTALLGADYCLHAVPVQVFQVPTMFSFFPYLEVL